MAGQEVQGMLIRLEATTAQLRQEMDRADASVTKATGRIDNQLGKVDSAFDRAGKSAQSAASILKGAFSLALGGVGVGAIIAQAEAYTAVANRLKLVTSNSQEFTAAQNAIFSIAQKSGQPLGATAELYQRIAQNQKELKLSGAGVAGIVETISKTMVISGASAESANAALIQLGQAFASGTLRGEELNSVMEQAPALSQAIAKGMGVSVGALRTLGSEGKLTADSVVKALQAQAGAVDDLFGKMQSTIGISLTRIQTSVTKIIGETDSLAGASVSVAGAINQASAALDKIKVPEAYALLSQHAETLAMVLNTVLFAALGKVAGGLAVSGGAAISNIKSMADLAIANQAAAAAAVRKAEVDLVSAINAVELARMNLALAVSVRDVATAERALIAAKGQALAMSVSLSGARRAEAAANITAASSATAYGLAMKVVSAAATGVVRAGAGLLALLGGPVGLLFIAGAVALSFVDFSSKSKTLMGDLGDLGKSVDQVRAEFNKLNEDQQRAQINTWKDKQLGATLAVEEAYKSLKDSIQSALVETPSPDMVDLAKVAEQVRAYDSVIAKMDAAKASGQALGPILREAAASGQISPAQLRDWETKAGLLADNTGVAAQLKVRVEELTGALKQDTIATQENNQAKAGFSVAGEKYLGTLQKQLAGLQDGGDAFKEASRYISEHTELSELDRVAILSAANAIESNKAATKAAAAETKAGTSAAKEAAAALKSQAKALDDLLAKSGISTKSASEMAAAYLAGADNVRAITIQQKIEEELLKTGAAARDKVTAAINALQNAEDRRDVSKGIAEMKVEIDQTLKQAAATLEGTAALEAYNLEKAVTVALTGKKIAVDSEEYKQLVATTKAQLDANKAMEAAGRVEGIIDRLNPEIKLLKDYEQAQRDIYTAMDLAPGKTALYQDALVKLGNEYEVNRSKATIWGQMTEGAIDRIDDAFANAWANIGDGASSLWDNLKTGFKQTLGEIAHMLTTKPLLASISNWLTGTDNGQGLSSVWGKLLGSAGGSSSGSSGGSMFSGIADIGKNLYSVYNAITGVGADIVAGYSSGGISGAISGGAGYYGNMLNGLVSTVSSGFTSLIGGNIAITGATTAGTIATQAALTGVTTEIASSAVYSVGAEGITMATLQGAIAEGAASVGTQIGVAGATTAAASQGIAGAISGALSSAAAMWPLAVIMGMYQSGKLYDAGVRPSMSEMQATGGDTALGKASMAPIALQSGIMELTDKINGSIVGGKLAAILSGSTLHQAVWGAVGKKLFGGGYENKDSGIQLDVTDGVFDAGGFVKQKKKGGLISGSSKTRYLQTDLAPELEDSLGAAYNDKVLSSMGIFAALGVTLSETVLDGLTMGVTRISTEGRTQEEIQTDLDAWFTSLGNSAVAAISDATSSGVGNYTFDELTTFTNNLYSINDMFKLLNINALPVSVWGGKLTEQYVAMAGGMEALQSAATSYYNAFFSETERADDTLAAVRAQFKSLNLTLPDTAPGFRAMVEGIDSTTDAGRSMYLTLMSLSDSAAAAYQILKGREKDAKEASDAAAQAALEAAQKITDALMSGVTNASSAVTRAIGAEREAVTKAYNAQVTSLNDMATTASQNVTDLSTVSSSLEAALKSLNGTSDDAVKTLRAQAQATLQSALATARAGGSLGGFTGLEDALDTVSSNNTDLYSSMEDFARDQGRTANVVAELNAINGKQLTSAEKSLAGLEEQIDLAKAAYDTQMDQFDQQLEFAQAQIDALYGVDNSVMSVAAAVTAMNAAVVAALAGIAGKATAGTSTNNGTLIDSVYQDLLDRNADAAGKAYWQAQLASGAISYDQLAAAIKNAAVANGSIPAFATGGLLSGPGTGTSDSMLIRASNGEYMMSAAAVRMFGTGLLDQMNAGVIPAFAVGGVVGDLVPQLELTGPSRIFKSDQSAAMTADEGDPGVTAEDMKTLIDIVRVGLNAIASSSKQTSEHTGQMAEVGVQVNNTVQTKAVA